MEELEASRVIPCGPKPGESAIQEARDFVPPEVQEWLDNPRLCLLPAASWPESPPKSRVRATETEWEKIVRAGVERGRMCRVDRPTEVLRDHNDVPVLNGAGGVKKVKTIGGEEKTLQRFKFISIWSLQTPTRPKCP